MARTRAKKSTANPLDDFSEGVISAVQEDVDVLYRTHARRISQLIENADGNIVTVRLALTIDKSESEPKVSTTIRFGETTTDQRVHTLSDPSQPQLFEPEPPKRGRPPKAKPDAEAKPEGEEGSQD